MKRKTRKLTKKEAKRWRVLNRGGFVVDHWLSAEGSVWYHQTRWGTLVCGGFDSRQEAIRDLIKRETR